MDPDSTPDAEREEPPAKPAPAPRSARSRTPARPPARSVADDAETREFPEEFLLGPPRPDLLEAPDQRISSDPRNGGDQRIGEPRIDPRPALDPRPEPRMAEPRMAEPRMAEPRMAEPRMAEPRMAEPVPADRSGETTVPTNIYRARRPAAAAMLVTPAVLFGLLLARGLAMSAFGNQFVLSGVVASSLALAALPLVVAGLYGLITGAAYGAEQWGFRVWARPPLAYLLVGVSLLLAAGLALR